MNMRLFIYTILFTLFFVDFVFAQSDQLDKSSVVDEFLDNSSKTNQAYVTTTKTRDDGFVSVTNLDVPYFNEQVVKIVKFNANGKFEFIKLLSDDKNPGYGTSIVQLNDGSFVVGGYSEIKKTKKRIAWIKQLSEFGDLIKTIEIPEDRDHPDFIPQSLLWLDNNVIILGTSDRSIAALECAIQTTSAFSSFWNIKVSDVSYVPVSLKATLMDDGIYIAASFQHHIDKSKKLWSITMLDYGLQIVHNTKWADYPVGNITRPILVNNNIYLAADYFQNRVGQSDIVVKVLDKDFNSVANHEIKKYGKDQVFDILEANSRILITGSSNGFRRGSATTDNTIWQIDLQGKILNSDPFYFGKENNEVIGNIFPSFDNMLYAVGSKSIGNKEVLAVTKLKYAHQTSISDISQDDIRLSLDTQVDITSLDPSDLHSLSYVLTNVSNRVLDNVQLLVSATQPGIKIPEKIVIPQLLPGSLYKFSVPVLLNNKNKGSSATITVSAKNQHNQSIAAVSKSLKVEKELLPKVILAGIYANENEEMVSASPGKTFTLQFDAINIWNKDLDNVEYLVKNNQFITVLSPPNKDQDLFSGQSSTKKGLFRLSEDYVGKDIKLPIQIISSNSQSLLTDTIITIPIIKYVEDIAALNQKSGTITPANSKTEKPEIKLTTKENPNSETEAKSKDVVVSTSKSATTTKKDGAKMNIEIKLNAWWDSSMSEDTVEAVNEKFPIKFTATFSQPLNIDNITIELNGVQTTYSGRKLEEVDIQRGKSDLSDIVTYFTLPLPNSLKKGKNIVKIKLADGEYLAELDKVIHYKAYDKGTLYIYAFGVPDQKGQLRYTSKDAMDFADLFRQQEGKIFGEVEIKTFTTKEETKAGEIATTLYNLSKKNYTDKDAIVVFMSSHGRIASNPTDGFLIQGSDFKSELEDKTAVRFQSEVLDRLEATHCKKYLFIDACHSGSLAYNDFNGRKYSEDIDFSSAINNFVKAANTTRTITSCQSQEVSFEDDAWENGAFTYSIKNILKDKTLCRQLDTNKDGGLSLGEIYSYLQKDVLSIVKQRKKETQTPYLNGVQNNSDLDPPFFAY